MSSRRQREWPAGGSASAASASGASTVGGGGSSIINRTAALASAYQELGKELSSGKLKCVGSYTLGRPIGEGTYGKVRMGVHRATGTRVAIKQVPKAHSASLTREIHHHRRLHHPNVMQLYEVVATESHIWMASELCTGGELYDYLVERGTLPEPEARRIFGQLCLAVAYIHGKGIVHRDLKLENVLLDERCNVKLGDFGFTREFEGKRLMDTFCGTTGYAAPEMLAGKKYTGEEVDLWSLGVILYALLCGALPFDDDDDDVMKSKILAGDYELPEVISEEAKDLLRGILQQEPTARLSIRSMLSHPWFAKVMLGSPMSAVEEDESGDAYFAPEAAGSAEPGEQPSDAALEAAPVVPVLAATPPKLPPIKSASLTVDEVVSSASLAPPSLGLHVQEASGASEASYHSAVSDSESSDRRSSRTGGTSPTTDPTTDNDDKSSLEGVSASEESPVEAPPLAIHRNESQTTIRREGSAGSDVSRKGPSAGGKATASSLPTHHESPGSTESSPQQNGAAPLKQVPSAEMSEVMKRVSSGSSRGHVRTPSRTKRRSLSSSGLSDHHPPHLQPRPIDYVSLIEESSPALFTSVAEQNLLHQLSNLGFDVGQIVHSVITDACDASGAIWWLLKLKADERAANPVPMSAVLPTPVPSLAPATPTPHAPAGPPPLPPKDPARQANSPASSPARKDARADVKARDRSQSVASPLRHDKIRVGHARGSTSVTDLNAQDAVPQPDAAAASVSRPRQADRARTNSFSVKLSSVLAGGARRDSPEVDDSQPPERSKSPVGALFSKKGTSTIKDRSRQPASPAKERVSGTRDFGSPEGSQTPVRKDPERDRERIRALIQADVVDKSPSRSTSGKQRALPKTNGDDGAVGDGSVHGTLSSSKSVDTFTTLSSVNDGDASASGKTRQRSSFLSTVRTWLGSEDKQARRRRKAQKNMVGSPPSHHGHEGSGYSSQSVARKGSVSRRGGGAYAPTSMAGSRRSPRSPQRGSLSRRSSSGSAQHLDGHGLTISTSRPPNFRRQSAGSITPTATVWGEADHPHLAASQRSSRPSSSASLHRPPPSGLHVKSGSASSANSILRKQQAVAMNSTMRTLHGRRPSTEGGSTVRRHRHYPGVPRSEGSTSRPASLYAPGDDGPDSAEAGQVGTPRRGSLESRRSAAEGSQGRASPAHGHGSSRGSVFTVHKSRSPYKPPSANPSLHSMTSKAQPPPDGIKTQFGEAPAAGTGTWRRSWGRPPPSWAGPVDQGPTRSELAATAAAAKPKLRDVFAGRQDDDWEDEDDAPTYAGGLGQLDTYSGSSWAGTSSSNVPDSPFPGSKRAPGASQQVEGGLLGSGRYAGIRSIFQPPSLGRDTMPRVLSMQLDPPDSSTSETPPSSTPGSAPAAKDASSASTNSVPSPSMGTARLRAPAPAFRTQVIEEEEEDE